MKCPMCGGYLNRVYDSRKVGSLNSIIRKRVCLHCGCHWTTQEKMIGQPRKGAIPKK